MYFVTFNSLGRTPITADEMLKGDILLHTNSKQEQENDSLSNIQNNHSLE
jgi:hypothetical protein